MGAAAGQMGCIANAIRICARYGNLDILEDGYGINLLPLATFAINTYGDDPCTCFQLKGSDSYSASEREMNQKMHKAISIIQFKAEGQIIKRHPEFGLEKRNLLHHIDFERGVLELGGKEYKMLDMNFPTVDPKDPSCPCRTAGNFHSTRYTTSYPCLFPALPYRPRQTPCGHNCPKYRTAPFPYIACRRSLPPRRYRPYLTERSHGREGYCCILYRDFPSPAGISYAAAASRSS